MCKYEVFFRGGGEFLEGFDFEGFVERFFSSQGISPSTLERFNGSEEVPPWLGRSLLYLLISELKGLLPKGFSLGIEEGRGEVVIWCKREFNGKRSFEVGLRRRYPVGLFRALNRNSL